MEAGVAQDNHALFECPNEPLQGIIQIPPDLVVKTQVVDIVEVVSQLLRRSNVV
jgi:hypothetical protein